MATAERSLKKCCLYLLVSVCLTSSTYAQRGDGNVLNSPADKSVAIRFFFQPPGDHFHIPLIFRVVDPNDSRLNTAPILDEGRTAYITLSDMQQLLPDVTRLPLLWASGKIVEVFGSSTILSPSYATEVTIVSSHGTASAAIEPKKICRTLGAMDSALKTPRALWEFQLFRTNYGCRVPGFNYHSYPESIRYSSSSAAYAPRGDGNVLNSPADKSVAIRFFFQPPKDRFHIPLIFRVVDPNDSRLNTAPILDEGRTAYITLSDMQQLLPDVTRLPLLWASGKIVEVFGSSTILSPSYAMEVAIVSSHGTATAAIQPEKICETLGPMDSALKTPRALWEFQLFRTNYGCRVPGSIAKHIRSTTVGGKHENWLELRTVCTAA
jgi:5-hydroxyisourate hydrolase-like protein (transthyretin family)